MVAWPRQELAYRLVRIPANSPDNFLPRPLEPGVPPRNIAVPTDSNPVNIRIADLENLNEWGISLFENPDAARRLAKMFKRAFQHHTHVAEVQINTVDGVCTSTDINKHFNLHESYTATLGVQVRSALPR